MRKLLNIFIAALVLGAMALSTAKADEPKQTKKQVKPTVEVVFCLDTTGSMSGLINAAKQKIWAMCNQIAGGKPAPNLKVGLVAYRDRGDQYVTKLFELTDDLDAVYANLMKFAAAGGGDTPESVNQALNEAVTKMKWNKDKKTLKIIFLVGDAPPKIYPNDTQYPQTCQLAVKNNIIINTIQCGNRSDTQVQWQKICQLAEGRYVRIDQKGGPIVVVSTPFDKDLAKINTKLNMTCVTWGTSAQQMMQAKKLAINGGDGTARTKGAFGGAPGTVPPGGFGFGGGVGGAGAPAPLAKAADRAAFYANSMRFTSYDLIEQIKNKKIKLEDIKTEHFPKEMRKMSLKQKSDYLKKMQTQREKLLTEARDLDKKRQAYIKKKQTEEVKSRGETGFDSQVLQILRSQATRSNIQYGVDEKKKKKSEK